MRHYLLMAENILPRVTEYLKMAERKGYSLRLLISASLLLKVTGISILKCKLSGVFEIGFSVHDMLSMAKAL